MDKNTFDQQLSLKLSEIMGRHPSYSLEGFAFTHWVLETVFMLSDGDARASNFDGTNDKGLDGFYIDENENIIRVIQCKNQDSVDNTDRDRLATLHDKLSNQDWIAGNAPRIFECSEQYVDKIALNYNIYFALIYNGEYRNSYKEELEPLIKNNLPGDLSDRCEVEVIGFEELVMRYLSQSPFGMDIPDNKDIRYENECVLNYETDELKAITLIVNGRELANFGNSPNMFLANFRHTLGKRNPVNTKISDTIKDPEERDKVWTYNNGITVICDSYDQSNTDEKVIHVNRPQIVNGCQTVSVLNRPEVKLHSDETHFLVRIIATEDGELKQKIATYTNSQTRVSPRTLRSNDKIQKSIQHMFNSWDPPVFYDCKDGQWDALSTDERRRFHIRGQKYRRVNNLDCAKAYHAFHGNPIDAKSKTKSIWDISNTGFYNDIFTNHRRAEELYLPYMLNNKFKNKIDYIKSSIDPETSMEDSIRDQYLSHGDTTLLAVAGQIIKDYLAGDYSSQNILALIDNIDSYADNLFERCEAPIKYEVKRTYEDFTGRGEYFNVRNYFLRIATIRTIFNKLDDNIESLGRDEFNDRIGLTFI